MSSKHRAGEARDCSVFKRSSRFVINDEGFFYRTRECDLIGPFNTESEALYDLNVFIKVTEIEAELQPENLLDY